MKKLLCLVFVLIALLGLTFAVSAADATKLSIGSVSALYKSDGTEGNCNGGHGPSQFFDGSYDGVYMNTQGSYIIVDLNALLGGGYYVTNIAITHIGNTKYSVYYTADGATWNPVIEQAKVAGTSTYAVNKQATQIKYVFDETISWTTSLCEIEVYGINPSELSCTHSSLTEDGWVAVEGSATCTTIGNQSQTCADCGEVFVRESAAVPALGHDFETEITKEGTNISYGEGIIKCTRCDYALEFKGEVDLTDGYYAAYGETEKYVSINPSSIGHQSWGSKAEYITDGTTDIIGWGQWYADTDVDENEYVLFNFLGILDLTKVDIWVPNDSNATLRISVRDMETGEFKVIKELATYDESLSGWAPLKVSTSLLGITTDSIKFQVFSTSVKGDGFLYGKMCVAEIDLYGIAPGCGLDASNHECVFDTFVEYSKAPTCKDAGVAVYKCTCNATTTVSVEPSEEFHNYVEVEGTRVDSTCTVAGYYTGKCEYCEAEMTIALELDAENGHAFGSEPVESVEADCVNAGSKTYKCENCDATKVEEVAALGHKYETVETAPTCTEAGSKVSKCSVCGDETTEEIPATGHTWAVDSIITEPTCGAEGEANYVCSCGATKVDKVEATGNHTWDEENVNVTLKPTCEGTGAGIYTCTVCNTTETKVIAALGHNFQEIEETRVPATCKEEGSITEKCANCGRENSKTLAIDTENGHNYETSEQVSAPTCTEAGETKYTCSICNGTKSEEIAPLGHSYESAAQEDGSVVYTCSVCGDTYTVNNALLNGTYIPEFGTIADGSLVFADGKLTAVDPEGNATEYTYVYNTTSNTIVSDAPFSIAYTRGMIIINNAAAYVPYTPPLEFVIGNNAIEVTDAWSGTPVLVTVPGKYVLSAAEGEENAYIMLEYGVEPIVLPYSFEVAAGETVTFVILTDDQSVDTINLVLEEVHEHVWYESDYQPATCTTAGYQNYYCDCGETKTEELPIDTVNGHTPNYSLEMENKEANCKEDGYFNYTCFHCGEVVNEVFESDPTAHVWDSEKYQYVAPTCQSAGYQIQVCSKCGVEVREDYPVNAEAHAWDDGVEINGGYHYECTLCDASKDEITRGTAFDPIIANIGDNTFVYYETGETFVVYQVTASNAGTFTITVDAGAGVYLGENLMGIYYGGFSTGSTSYNFEVESAGQYMLVFSLEEEYTLPESFNVAFTEKVYPTFNEGDNSVTIDEIGGSAQYIVNVPGEYTITLGENAALYIIYSQYYSEMVENGFGFTVGEGEKVMFDVGTENFQPGTVVITLTKKVTHVHTEEAIPAVRPTPTVTGYTAGVKCSDCGEVLVVPVEVTVTDMEDTKDPDFRVAAASLTLMDSIIVNYKSVVTAGYNNPYMVFVFMGEEYVVESTGVEASTGRLIFDFDKVEAHWMNENIEAYLYAETAEGAYSRNMILEYSVKNYAINQLKKNDAALTTVISDLLVMGAKTQVYTNYKTNELVTDVVAAAGYTLTPSTFTGVDASYNIATPVTGDRTTGTDWKSGAVYLGSRTILQLKFVTDDVESLSIKVTVGNETKTYTAENFEYDETSGRYVVNVDFFSALQYGENVVGTFERNGETIGSTITYSVNAYAYRNADSATGATKDLIQALYVYGQSVEAYFGE